MEPPLDLERFATLSAEINAGTQRDELCAREGISLADWNASQEAWLARLADETAGKRFVLTNRYNTAFVARRRALTHGPRFPAHKPVAARKAEVVAPPPVEVAPPPPVMVSLPALAAPPLPNYLQPEAPPSIYRQAEAPLPVHHEPEPPHRHAPPKAPTMAMPAFTEPVTAALPFARPSGDAGTESVTAAPGPLPLAQSRTALPFRAAEPIAALPPAAVAARPADLPESSTITGASPFASPAAALPFQPVAAPPSPATPPAPVKRPSSPPPSLDGNSTLYGAISPFASQAAALPFAGAQAPAPARASTPHSGAGLPFQQKAVPPPPPSAPAAAPPLPPPSAAVATRLTLEQFASLTAEIAVNPRGAAQIRARYGFDEASHRAEAEEHNRRFNADPALLARYMELFQAYREYVARAPR